MDLKTTKEEGKLTILISGRLDTVTAPELEKVVDNEVSDASDVVFDLSELEYTSSAGLRIFLKTRKLIGDRGGVTLAHASESVTEVLEMTGFTDIFNIE